MTRLFIPENLRTDSVTFLWSNRYPFRFDGKFFQMALDRLIVGAHRHKGDGPHQKYLTRLKKAVASYEKTGNVECLLDAHNYAMLEAHYPENEKCHLSPTDSAGRTQRVRGQEFDVCQSITNNSCSENRHACHWCGKDRRGSGA
jgi:hypothetical protein